MEAVVYWNRHIYFITWKIPTVMCIPGGTCIWYQWELNKYQVWYTVEEICEPSVQVTLRRGPYFLQHAYFIKYFFIGRTLISPLRLLYLYKNLPAKLLFKMKFCKFKISSRHDSDRIRVWSLVDGRILVWCGLYASSYFGKWVLHAYRTKSVNTFGVLFDDLTEITV